MATRTSRPRLNPKDEDVLYVKLPNRTSFRTIQKTLAQLDDVLRMGSDAPTKTLLLDLSSVVFCSATAITILAALLEHLFQRGKLSGGQIWLPKSQMALNYLQRMNFFDELEIPLPETFVRREPRNFLPVTHVAQEKACIDVTRELVGPCQRALKVEQGTVSALKACVSEIIENVFAHAQSPTDALVSSQAYKSKERIELVIADTGRGVKDAFAESEKYADRRMSDCEAIRFAMQKHVSTTDDSRRGIGLWFVSEMARANKGEFLMLSKEGGVRINETTNQDVDHLYWPGTFVAIEFRLDMPINMNDVYASGDFASVDSLSF